MTKEPFFFLEAACVACKPASAADNTMARNDNADGIAAHSLSHSLSRHFHFFGTNCCFPGNIPVGYGLTVRNSTEDLPDLLLERCSSQMNGEIRFIWMAAKIGIQPISDQRKNGEVAILIFHLFIKVQTCEVFSVTFHAKDSGRRMIVRIIHSYIT